MTKNKSFQEKTSADDKSIGFEYQYYYFLYRLLKLKPEESIGLEVRDDVHLELSDGRLILIQLKHTVKTSSDGSGINLRERDIDLWKTLYNWINVIKDEEEGRKLSGEQITFINKAQFLLVSNKHENDNNTFLKKINDLKERKIKISDIRVYINSLISTTVKSEANEKLLLYMSTVAGQNDNLLNKFLNKISFELDQDNLLEKIRNVIQYEKIIDENRVDDVLHSLDSSLRSDNYINVKSKNKIIISCNDFYKKYRMCFEHPRIQHIPVRKWTNIVSDKMEDQIFIKQLVDLDEINQEDYESIAEFTRYKVLMENNIIQWIHNGEITQDQEKAFHKNAKLKWNNYFKLAHLKSKKILGDPKIPCEDKEDKIRSNSLECLYNVRLLNLDIDDLHLDDELSNGEFYSLSDIPVIGWNLNWEEKYKK